MASGRRRQPRHCPRGRKEAEQLKGQGQDGKRGQGGRSLPQCLGTAPPPCGMVDVVRPRAGVQRAGGYLRPHS